MATAPSETVKKILSLETLLKFAQDHRTVMFDETEERFCLGAQLTGNPMYDFREFNWFKNTAGFTEVDPRFAVMSESLPITRPGFDANARWYTGGQLAYGILLLIDGVHPHDAAERVATYATESAGVPT